MSIYDRLRNTAEKLLTKYGQTETLYSPSGTPIYSVKAIFLPLEGSATKQDIPIEIDLENSEVSKVLFFSSTEITVTPGFYITKNSTIRYTIIEVTNVKPTNTQIYYDCIGQR